MLQILASCETELLCISPVSKGQNGMKNKVVSEAAY